MSGRAARDVQPTFPIRAAFYYPWYPEAWKQSGIQPFSKYTPSLSFYSSTATNVIQRHVRALAWGRIQVAIASWWGRGHRTDARLGQVMSVSTKMKARLWWAAYYENESQGDPSVEQIRSDLGYLASRYGKRPSYLRMRGRFVVFVYAAPNDGCDMVKRWKQANTVGAYVVLKVFPGYRSCADQPDGWHQYAPANAVDNRSPDSFTISPGFAKATESAPRLPRDLNTWQQNVRAMVASRARFQLISTFNEWGEGTSVESATAWATRSGYGAYLDALHSNGANAGTPAPAAQQPPPPTTTAPPAPPPPPANGKTAVVLAAGDIASCRSPGDEATAALVQATPAASVLTLGDNAYESGSESEYASCYAPTWGQFLARTHPAVGNHEYLTPDASAYFSYFGAAAGPPDKGYYSFDVGAWHLVSLNSNCSRAGGCGEGSPQLTWLRADLATHRTRCTLAFWHHPRFSSGEHGNQMQMAPIWQALYTAGADVVLSGHDHDYERFAPQDGNGGADAARGIREFVVGTGGKNHYPFSSPQPNSEVRNDTTFGVIELTLRPTGYDWQFLPEAGKTFTDSGSGACH
jgi:hypothetical protein